jgi:hypothetical protein
MPRWKAAFIHLLISFTVVGAVAAAVLYFWYPPALFHMAKADELLMIIARVDLVVGPLLTLIVYKAGKATLRFDLSVIALLQAAFLSYGLYSLFVTRPVFMVASATTFDLVFANEILPDRLAQASQPRFSALGFGRPVLVGAIMPSDSNERMKIVDSMLGGGGDLQTMPRYYVDYDKVAPTLPARAQPLRTTMAVTQAELDVLTAAARRYGREPGEVLFMRLGSIRGSGSMLIDAKTGAVVGPVGLNPYAQD